MLSNKGLGENENVFYFYFKTEGTFWPTQIDGGWGMGGRTVCLATFSGLR